MTVQRPGKLVTMKPWTTFHLIICLSFKPGCLNPWEF